MAPEVIARVCPRHRYMGVARLRDHRLAFTRKSIRTGTGVADVIQADGNTVWGVLYEISADELARMDRKEGYDWAYTRVEIPIQLQDGRKRAAVVYTVRYKEATEVLPSRQYLDQIIRAARVRGLPTTYVRQLEAVTTAGNGTICTED
jgi:gamma-glutamylcyclotransferase (GGCT)/AIG2-like uncharacterized protein YtfP